VPAGRFGPEPPGSGGDSPARGNRTRPFRRRHPASELPVRMPLFPWMQYAGLTLLAAILITMGLNESFRASWRYGVPWLALISAAYFLRRTRARAAQAQARAA